MTRVSIEEDIYGNIKRRIAIDVDYYERVEYEYNDKGDLVSKQIFNKKDAIIQEFLYEIHYDDYGNIFHTKDRVILYYDHNYDSFSEQYRDNYYDNNHNLVKVDYRYDTTIVHVSKFFYEDNKLIKNEFYRDSPFDSPTNISYFSYNNEGEITEEKICLRTGEVSHYIEYTLIKDNRYRKKMINPERSKYRWTLYEIDNMSCMIDLYETTLTGDLMSESIEYIRNNYSNINYIMISVNGYAGNISDPKELTEIKNYYKEKHNITVSLTH